MANKRRQDEKHLKVLRCLSSLPHNKNCFDCNQRGPTYCNMTIGAFVCTTCSGVLRGINPPHRVKSISMASFSPDEIEYLRSRGNDFCRKVYLGLYDPRTSMEPNSKDEQKLKDFMSHKYEKKRWYVAPTEEWHEEARRINCIEKQNETKQTTTIRNTMIGTVPSPRVTSNLAPVSTPSTQVASTISSFVPKDSNATTFNLISDLNDTFTPKIENKNVASFETNFANFDAFNEKVAAPVTSTPSYSSQSSLFYEKTASFPTTTQANTNKSMGDKYAALAALDTEFGVGVPWSNNSTDTTIPTNQNTSMNFPTGNNFIASSNSAPSGFGTVFSQNYNTESAFNAVTATNPFTTMNSVSQQPTIPSYQRAANPFMNNQQNMNFNWNYTPAPLNNSSANPFMQNTNSSQHKTNSTNPFL